MWRLYRSPRWQACNRTMPCSFIPVAHYFISFVTFIFSNFLHRKLFGQRTFWTGWTMVKTCVVTSDINWSSYHIVNVVFIFVTNRGAYVWNVSVWCGAIWCIFVFQNSKISPHNGFLYRLLPYQREQFSFSLRYWVSMISNFFTSITVHPKSEEIFMIVSLRLYMFL